ncbi:MAG: family transporter [Massilia sp.]|nr:family transporter [Massilia sp.]
MLDILAITSPIYVAILLGFVTTRTGMFDKAAMRMFGAFVIKLALPALLFKALAQRRIGEILNVSYLVAYAGASLALLGVGYLCCRRLAGMDKSSSAIYVMGMSISNSAFVGYPILLLTFAPVAGVALALNVIVENVIVFPVLLALAERGRGDSGPWHRLVAASLARLASNPIILGTAAGVAVSLSGWTLPAPVERTVSLFANASSALSLFVIGGALVGVPVAGLARRAAPIVFFKLVGHPLAVLAATLVVPLLGLPRIDSMLGMAAVLLAAMPMASVYPIMAQAYGHEDLGATALLLTTIASFFTLSGVLWLMHRVAV